VDPVTRKGGTSLVAVPRPTRNGPYQNRPHLVVNDGLVQTYDICDWRRQMGEDGGRFTGALR